MTVEQEVKQLMGDVVAQFGRIDVLDNNAAALELLSEDLDVTSLEADILTRTLAANVVGPFLCTPVCRCSR